MTDLDVAALGGEPSRDRVLRARGRETVGRLLAAGLEVVAERGHDETRIDDVVSRAEVSHGTFYLYFRDREDLLASLTRLAGESLQPLADSLPQDGDVAALAAWFEAAERAFDRHVDVLRAAESVGDDGAVTALVGPVALALHRAGGQDTDLVARMVMSHFTGAIVRGDVIDTTSLAEVALRACSAGPATTPVTVSTVLEAPTTTVAGAAAATG